MARAVGGIDSRCASLKLALKPEARMIRLYLRFPKYPCGFIANIALLQMVYFLGVQFYE